MLRSHIRTAIRNFKRNSITSFINLSGLSLGAGSCLVAALYISHAFILAASVAYFIMTSYWLSNFTYRTTVDAFVYLSALGVVFLMSALAVGSQTLCAAAQNPAETLKEE